MKILCIVGARPNFPKIAPLLREMKKYEGVEALLVHTGQHFDVKMSHDFFVDLDLPVPDVNLGIGSGTHAQQTAAILATLEPELIKYRPDIVLVVGDTNSTLAAALTAAKLNIPVAHVEAGLRSFDRSMPEEINRVVTDSISTYLFASEPSAVRNLEKEGHASANIYLVGNVMLDSLFRNLPRTENSRIGVSLGVENDEGWKRFALLTLHRASNTDSPKKFAEIMRAACALSDEIPVVFPIHPRTRPLLSGFRIPLFAKLSVMEPLGYLDFLCLMSHATLVLTDSGGIQEETAALNVPCLTLRENTERPLTIERGTNVLVGTESEAILGAASAVLRGERKHATLPWHWDGHAARRIVKILLDIQAVV